MKLLLDEDVPAQLLEPLRHLLPGHQVDHVDSDVPRFHRRADRRGGDQISVVPAVASGQAFAGLSRTVSVEGGHGHLRHQEDATRTRRLRLDEPQLTRSAMDSALDAQHVIAGIEIAAAPGRAVLELHLRRPWERDESPAEQLRFVNRVELSS